MGRPTEGDGVLYFAFNTRDLLFTSAGNASISLIGPLTASRGSPNHRTIGFAGAGRAIDMMKKPLSTRRKVSAVVTANREEIVGEPILFLVRR